MNIGTDISYAASLLNDGDVVAIPTETVYGLAANAYDPNAIIKIFAIKKRPRFNPLIVHIPSIEHLHLASESLDFMLRRLAEKFWPGPLTVLAKRSEKIHKMITSGSELVAIRVPHHAISLQLLNLLGFPLAAPSANEFGRVSPTSANHVASQLGDKIKYILDGGIAKIGVESTIVKIESGKVIILRPGGISPEQIADVTGYIPVITKSRDIEAPGMLKGHYAPRIQLLMGDFASLAKEAGEVKIAALNFIKRKEHPQIVAQAVLSPSGELTEAARNLFSALHELENSGADIIIAEVFPDEGMGLAINDRLKRASS